MTATPRLGSRTLAVATAAMAVLLVVLAVLQYHWVGEVSEAARERLRRGLETSADRIADDFDREVFRAFVAFQPPHPHEAGINQDLAEALADGWERWRASALEPELVAAVYVVDPERAASNGDAALSKLDPEARDLRPAPWPPQLSELDQRLDLAGAGRRPPAIRSRAPRLPVLASAPALLLPIRRFPRARTDDDDTPPDAGALVVVLLDREVVERVLLPALIELHLGPEPREIEVWVLDRTRRGEPVFATGPVPEPSRRPDPAITVVPLLALRFFPELRAQGFHRFFDDPDAGRLVDVARRPAAGLHGGTIEQGQWALVLARTEGSLDDAVSRLRRRNLGVGLAVVALLGAAAALLLASARRVQRLAQREMELVAGITHELRTPLAAIGSAADNLADGVVSEPDQVRRYGGLIKSEAHRLGALVAQVLDFAGTAAARRRARSVEPVDVGAIVDRVLEDHRFTIEERGVTVDRRQAHDAQRALADPDALRRALDNVVGNALKYGEAGRWLGVEIGLARDGGADRSGEYSGHGRITLRVRDRGPGIARADRRRVFEPFYRGSGASGHLHGTGLGLSVTRSMLESLGGSIEIEESETGRGTTFLITLSAAPP